MIIQGSNIPIYIELPSTDLSITDISVSLMIPGTELKHWDMDDLNEIEEYRVYAAPISQTESKDWEPGACTILVKWTDEDGITEFTEIRDTIKHWHDKTILQEADT